MHDARGWEPPAIGQRAPTIRTTGPPIGLRHASLSMPDAPSVPSIRPIPCAPLSKNRTTPGTTPFPPRESGWSWPPACTGCAWRCRLRWTTSICGCCATTAGTRAGRWWIAALPTTAHGRPGSSCLRGGLDGKPVRRVIVTHMHPDHVGLAHWLTQRWSRPAFSQRRRLRVPAVDERHRPRRGAPGQPRRHLDGRRRRSGLHGIARPGGRGVPGEDPHPRRLLCRHGARGARLVPSDDGWRHDRHRRAHLALHRRPRPCA